MKLLSRGVLLLSLAAITVAQAPHHPVPRSLKCPGDQIVWVNTKSGVYHFKGERDFGSTKEGQYMCQKQADAAGDRATKNGQ
jgi:hypothetical protein